MSDPLEDWFRLALAKPGCTLQHLAAAMQEDGVGAAQSWALAAAAQIRYGSAPLRELLTDPAHLDALQALRRHAAAARCPPPPPAAARRHDPRADLPNRLDLPGRAAVRVQCVSHSPRAALLGGFLDADECDALIALARRRLQRNRVTDSRTGASRIDRSTRSSRGVFLDPEDGTIVARIEARAARLLGCPVSHLESLALNRYGRGGEFREHVDYLDEPGAAASLFSAAGDRVATLVLYLSEVPGGGATVFPVAGLEFRPQRGSALWFGYREPDGGSDPASLHAGAPVARGAKWIATLWAHARPVRLRKRRSPAPG